LLLTLLLLACAPAVTLIPTPTPPTLPLTPQILRVVCPPSLAPTMMALGSAYRQVDPTTQVIVVKRADPLAARALEEGDADLAALTWVPPEYVGEAWTTPFARDGLAIVVHPQNGLPGLTMIQLQRLFKGQVEDWAMWGGLPGTPEIISREEESGAYAFFQSHAMRETRVTLTALLAPSTEAVLQSVGDEPLAVGYLSTAWVDGRVRPLAIEGVPPTSETLNNGLYPLTRDLHVMTMTEPQGATRDFIQWLLSPAGEEILAAQRFQAPAQ
jgi:phosphate transport system substrate-binding protein